MPKGSPLRYRDLLSRLKDFGVEEKRVGSGSRRMLYKANVEGLNVAYPIHPHSLNDEVNIHIIRTVIRRFKISPDAFWG